MLPSWIAGKWLHVFSASKRLHSYEKRKLSRKPKQNQTFCGNADSGDKDLSQKHRFKKIGNDLFLTYILTQDLMPITFRFRPRQRCRAKGLPVANTGDTLPHHRPCYGHAILLLGSSLSHW